MRTVLFLIGLMLCATGCSTMVGKDRDGVATHSSRRGGSGGELSNDPWVNEAGEFSRQIHEPEKVADPWNIRDIFTSEKTRAIERNLGVGP